MSSPTEQRMETGPRPGLLAVVVVLLVSLVFVVVLVVHRRQLREEPSKVQNAREAQVSVAPDMVRTGPDAPRVVAVNVVQEEVPRSPLADRLNAPDGGISEDLRIVASLLENLDSALGAMPVGNNAEITAGLSGRNARSHAPLPADHPSISGEGELLDRWGRPFIFHPVSRHNIELRSHGPDGEAYTADDSVLTTGPRPAWLEEPGTRPEAAAAPSP